MYKSILFTKGGKGTDNYGIEMPKGLISLWL